MIKGDDFWEITGAGVAELGRRKGLKIPRTVRGVPVRFRPPAPIKSISYDLLATASFPLNGTTVTVAVTVLSRLWASTFLEASLKSSSDTIS